MHVPVEDVLQKLSKSAKLSDIKIRCGDREWPAHRAILCVRSEYFDKALSGALKEATENTIELHDDHPNAVHAMLEWFYSGNYSYCQTHSIFELCVLVHDVANRHLLDDLKMCALEAFSDSEINPSNIEGFVRVTTTVYNASLLDQPWQKVILDVVRLSRYKF
ncbi:Kelch-like protein 10 [Saxophila tyrrhenica]|uniref:Kelch-like protein 10 n=1 Tax=Saxophila tyrrhenica TaxID=1690608 RepID=A0AAV9P3C8_9PEZI|nr:Kelch-like protein 10 [Saxophila tyrrhenica]